MSQLQSIQVRRRSGFEDAYFSLPVEGGDPTAFRDGMLVVRVGQGDDMQVYSYPMDTIDHVRAYLVEE